MFRSVAFASALLAATAVPASAANLLTNGSFEAGSGGSPFQTISAGQTNITGWSVDSGSVDFITGYWAASNGVRSIDIAGSSIGKLSQTFNTVMGATYTVRFDLSSNPDISAMQTARDLLVSINGGPAQTFTHPGATGKDLAGMNWLGKSFSFVGTGAPTTLSFTTNGTAGTFYGPALDNVSVTVPEPASWALMISGFGLVGGAMRRRQGRVALA